MKNDLRTPLVKAKGLGAAKTGSQHWWHQRLTAIIMLPLTIWLVVFIKCNRDKDVDSFLAILQKPYYAIAIGLFAVVAIYHSLLGMRVIIEDYISCSFIRNSLNILLQIFCMVTIISLVVALLQMILR